MKPILDRPDRMNKTERAYADLLYMLKLAGDLVDYRFEGIRFRLADGSYYKPDFLVVYKDRFEIHEVKGHWREAAKVRIKVAAELFPWFKFVEVRKNGKNDWSIKEI